MWVQRAALGENCQEKLVWCQTSTFLLRKDVNQSNWVSWGRAKINHNRISVPHLTSAWEKEEIKEILQHILVAWFRATMHCLPFSLGCKVSVLHCHSRCIHLTPTMMIIPLIVSSANNTEALDKQTVFLSCTSAVMKSLQAKLFPKWYL